MLLISPPSASTSGPSPGTRSPSGTIPRANASSFPMAIGSSERFPEVMTSAISRQLSADSWEAWKSSRCSGAYAMMTPIVGFPGATDSGSGQPSARGAMTMGATGEVSRCPSSSVSSTNRRAAASDATITANGFSALPFLARSVPRAASSVASHARWNPPTPRTATIFPSVNAAAARVIASHPAACAPPEASQSDTLGPHSGHEFVSEWKRRSAGSPYSRAHAGHIVNGAIDVRALS